MSIEEFWLQTDPGDLRTIYFWAGSISSIYVGRTYLLTIVNPMDQTGFRIDSQEFRFSTSDLMSYFSYVQYAEVKALC